MKDHEIKAETLATEIDRLWCLHQSSDSREYEKQAINMCNEVIEELLKQYKPVTVVKTIQPIYRKALIAKTGCDKYTQPPICWFRVDPGLTAKINETTHKKIATTEEYIEVPAALLESLQATSKEILESTPIKAADYYSKAVAIALCSGRRMFAEILRNGFFEEIDSESLLFLGQAKTTKEKSEQGYIIPVLCDSNLLVKNLEMVQSYVESRVDDIDSIDEKKWHDKFKSMVKAAIDKNYNIQIVKTDLAMLTAHDLRKLYAAYCTKCFKPANIKDNHYLASILGHSRTDSEGSDYANLATPESYKKYIIVD